MEFKFNSVVLGLSYIPKTIRNHHGQFIDDVLEYILIFLYLHVAEFFCCCSRGYPVAYKLRSFDS